MKPSETNKKQEPFVNPIDDDSVTDTPNTLSYGHHRGSLPVKPTEEGQIKSKALSAMESQTDIQLSQIKEQMELLAKQAQRLQQRVDISKQIYSAKIRFEPLINHIYHLYKTQNNDFVLLMLSPYDWGRRPCPHEYVASVKLLADHTWDIVAE